jgi:hypothetical protein
MFEDADEIRDRYGFRKRFRLGARLEVAAGMFAQMRSAIAPTAKQRRQRLDLIEKETRAILRGQGSRREALAKLLVAGGSAGLPFADEKVERALATGNLENVLGRKDLKALLKGVAAARAPLERRRPPVSGDAARRILVQELATIWQKGTGKPPAATWDEAAGKHGEAILFMCEVLRRVGDRISAEAVRHLLRRARPASRRATGK